MMALAVLHLLTGAPVAVLRVVEAASVRALQIRSTEITYQDGAIGLAPVGWICLHSPSLFQFQLVFKSRSDVNYIAPVCLLPLRNIFPDESEVRNQRSNLLQRGLQVINDVVPVFQAK
jgi:hypothetical protein